MVHRKKVMFEHMRKEVVFWVYSPVVVEMGGRNKVVYTG